MNCVRWETIILLDAYNVDPAFLKKKKGLSIYYQAESIAKAICESGKESRS